MGGEVLEHIAFSTMEAHEYVCNIDRTGNITASPARNLQKAATNLLCSAIQKRDFAQPFVRRATRVLGPIRRHHVAQIIPMVRKTARASRSGLAVGIFRVCATACAQRDDFTLKMKITHAEWNVTVSPLQRVPTPFQHFRVALEERRVPPS